MTTAVMSSSSEHDPLAAMLAPPPNESISDRDRRLRAEAEAKRISDSIDELIRQEAARKKKANEIKLLLLGQSSSGKSTLQKQFQLMYAPAALDLERASWRPVVYINLIKSVRMMFDALDHEYDLEIDRESSQLMSPSLAPSFMSASTATPRRTIDVWDDSPIPSSSKGKGKARDIEDEGDIVPPPTPSNPISPAWAQQIATLHLRLTPLLSMEESLGHKIGMGVEVAPGREEVFVRSGWQGVRSKRWSARRNGASARDEGSDGVSPSQISMNSGAESASTTSTDLYLADQKAELVRQVSNLLVVSQDDVEALYNHPAVKALIKKRRLRLEESSTFFLTNLERIACSDYMPSNDDILHARLRTMGVVEHYFEVPISTGSKMIGWRLYDVGGARGQRPSWVPYFEDATAIIFLAPISAFDQYLEEDPRTNRVDDSLQLFTLLCSNPLLKNCHLVLFLNKTDVLRRKLEMGVKVKKYITSYGDRPNDYENVSSYFLAHFRQVHRKNNVDAKRELYPHLTSVVNTKSTRQIIVNVRDAIFRDYLKESSIL